MSDEPGSRPSFLGEQLQAAAAYDPFDPRIPRFQASAALAGRKYDRALRLAAQAQQLAASTGSAHFDDLTARVHAAMGEWGECVRSRASATWTRPRSLPSTRP